MMKKYFATLFMILIVGVAMLTGCANSNSINLKITEVGIKSSYSTDMLGNKIIKNYKDLQFFVSEYSNYFYLNYETSRYAIFAKTIKNYDSGYFEKKYLAIYIKEDAVTFPKMYKFNESKVENNILQIYVKTPSSSMVSPGFSYLIFISEIEVGDGITTINYNFL